MFRQELLARLVSGVNGLVAVAVASSSGLLGAKSLLVDPMISSLMHREQDSLHCRSILEGLVEGHLLQCFQLGKSLDCRQLVLTPET